MSRVRNFIRREGSPPRETVLMAPGILILLILGACGPDGSVPAGEDGPREKVAALLDRDLLEEAEEALGGLSPEVAKADWAVYSRGEIALMRALKAEDPSKAEELAVAEKLFEKTLDISPDHYMARVSLGKVFGLKGELVTAVKNLETARDSARHRADAYFELGRIYVGSGEVNAAVSTLEEGLGKEEGRADGYMLYGDVLLHYRRQIDEALKAYRHALKIEPDFLEVKEKLSTLLLTLGVRALNTKKYDDVLRITDEVLELSPENAEAHNLRGQVYVMAEETGKAVDEFRKCLACDSNHREGRYYLARALVKEGYQLLFMKRRDEALKLFREALDLDAPDVDLTVIRRILEDRTKPESREPGETTAATGPKAARLLFEEATALLEAGKAEEALGVLRSSLKILPENPYAHHQAGLALAALNRLPEAEEELKVALDQAKNIDIDLPATYLKLAELAIKGERFDEAKAYLDEHDERFPDQATNPIAVGLRRLLILADK